MTVGFGNTSQFEPYLSFTFIDPQLTKDGYIPEKILGTMMDSNCSAWKSQIIPVTGANFFSVSRTDIHDEIRVWNDPQGCDIGNLRSESFSLYDVSNTRISYNNQINLTWCDESWESYDNVVCGCEARIYLDSQVTKRTSHRGTDAITILVEESGIAGGVMFFTWFLGLYVL